MKVKNFLFLNILIVSVVLTNCSAVSLLKEPSNVTSKDDNLPLSTRTLKSLGQANGAQSTEYDHILQSTETVYLPLVNKQFPYTSIFGVEFFRLENLDRVKESGVDLVRGFVISWDLVQPTEISPYQWDRVSGVEEMIRRSAQSGLSPIIVIMHSAEWARKYPDSRCGPIREEKIDDFSFFVAEVVKRYSQHPYYVKYYQIWNEPDAPVSNNPSTPWGCWGESSDPYFGGEYYGKMLREVYSSVKSINPNVFISPGSLLLDCDPRGIGDGFCPTLEESKKWNFFEGVVKSAENSFDFVGFHTYAYYDETGTQNSPVWKERNRAKWWKNGGVVDGKISYLREVMQKYNIEKPLMITEAGLLFSDQPFPDEQTKDHYENQKADYLVWVYANSWSQGVKGVTWYAFEGWRKTELIRNGEELPAFHALKTMTGFLKYADYISREDNVGHTKFIYRNGNEIIWLLIPTGQQYGMEYSIPIPSKFKKAIDLFGNEQAVTDTIRFSRPTYVFLNQ